MRAAQIDLLFGTTDLFARLPNSKSAIRIVEAFRIWMLSKDLGLSRLRPVHLKAFLDLPYHRPIAATTRRNYERLLVQYLGWAREEKYIGRDWDAFLVARRKRRQYILSTLQEPARAFLESLKPTHRPSTCHGYKSNLQHFHSWLDQHGITLGSLRRSHTEKWFIALKDQGLHPSTRLRALTNIRTYLRWLNERKRIRHHPDDLIRRADFPKLPLYLPRPLPPEADARLQSRLANSDSLYMRGLALMRSTGLRIGELRALEYDCVRLDHDSRRFLKVPLGKMNNERLVPLDEVTCQLIDSLRSQNSRHRNWLLATPDGEQLSYEQFRVALREACVGLETAGPMTTHRLRHTYATSLLNAGISIVALMRLLGHRDHRMTLRYAALTDATVGKEYFQALQQIETKYPRPSGASSAEPDPQKLLADVARWIRTHLNTGEASNLTKKISRIRSKLRNLSSEE